MDYVLVAVSFAIILAGALLFTNAIEWLGHKLNLGEGAVGSLLAAVGTAMPETLVPTVAIVGGATGRSEVAAGAVVGARALLGTIAMALVGVSALAYVQKRPQGKHLDVHVATLDRDLMFFMIFFSIALVIGLLDTPKPVDIAAGVIFLCAYGWYVRETIKNGGDVAEGDEIEQAALDEEVGNLPDHLCCLEAISLRWAISVATINSASINGGRGRRNTATPIRMSSAKGR